MEEFQCQIDLRQVESATKTVSEIILSIISTSLAFFNYMGRGAAVDQPTPPIGQT